MNFWTDILAWEDFSVDMDFKVAGTDSAVTATMDVKSPEFTVETVKAILDRAKTARLEILEKLKRICQPKSCYFSIRPKIEQVKIPWKKSVKSSAGEKSSKILCYDRAQVGCWRWRHSRDSGTDDEAVKSRRMD